jgi:hypothetical protein
MDAGQPTRGGKAIAIYFSFSAAGISIYYKFKHYSEADEVQKRHSKGPITTIIRKGTWRLQVASWLLPGLDACLVKSLSWGQPGKND